MKSVHISGPAGELSAALRAAGDPAVARLLQGFFKTGPGQYGEGDRFAGIKVPVIRTLVKQFRDLSAAQAQHLVRSPIHEERLAGLLLWVDRFQRGEAAERAAIFQRYLANTRFVNNWDLVDLSAPQIVGGSVDSQKPDLLRELSRSASLWERRIAVIATLAFIRQSCSGPTLELCERLLGDRHDLMHKACGWMLREVGKRDRATLSGFLDRHAAVMPRTMLRYALEHYPEATRQHYLAARKGVSPSGTEKRC